MIDQIPQPPPDSRDRTELSSRHVLDRPFSGLGSASTKSRRRKMLRSVEWVVAVFFSVSLARVVGGIDELESLKSICDSMKEEEFSIVYAEYGWSLWDNRTSEEKKERNARLDDLIGFCPDMFQDFLRLCPIKFKLYQNPSELGLWGKLNETTGQWIGMVNELISGRADMALTYYYIQPQLVNVVDFSRAFMSAGIAIVMKWNRGNENEGLQTYMAKSFTIDGWLLIVAVVPIGFVAVIAIDVIYPPSKYYAHFDAKDTQQYHQFLKDGRYFTKILWFMTYAALGFDDVNRSLYNVALRLLAVFWIFYFWIIFNLFSAQLTSDMTLAKMPHHVSSFSDLLREPGLRFFFDGGDTGLKKNLQLHQSKAGHDLLKKYDSFGELHAQMFAPKDAYLSADEILNFTDSGQIALLSEGIDVPVMMKKDFSEQCDIYMVTDYTIRVDPAYIFRKNSQKARRLKDAFNIFLSIINRNGKLDDILVKWKIPYPGQKEVRCNYIPSEQKEQPVSAQISALELLNFTLICISGIFFSVGISALNFFKRNLCPKKTKVEDRKASKASSLGDEMRQETWDIVDSISARSTDGAASSEEETTKPNAKSSNTLTVPNSPSRRRTNSVRFVDQDEVNVHVDGGGSGDDDNDRVNDRPTDHFETQKPKIDSDSVASSPSDPVSKDKQKNSSLLLLSPSFLLASSRSNSPTSPAPAKDNDDALPGNGKRKTNKRIYKRVKDKGVEGSPSIPRIILTRVKDES